MIVIDTHIWVWWVQNIVIDSTQLSGFHSDPFDQIIVATARFYDSPLLTADAKILAYSGVKTLK